MTAVILFHSALGLRDVEREAARLLRADGHEVDLPDLYDGRVAADLESGLVLMRDVGWDAITARARAAVAKLPDSVALMGISMGAGVVAEIWNERPMTSAVLAIHAQASIPRAPSTTTRVELHAGDADSFVPKSTRAEWVSTAQAHGLRPNVWIYPGLGHFFTDPASPDYDEAGATTVWHRIRESLDFDSRLRTL